eukprot:7794020-Heterocapsa_arctica.AAC.1
MGHISPILRQLRGRLLERARPVLPTPGACGLTAGRREGASARCAAAQIVLADAVDLVVVFTIVFIVLSTVRPIRSTSSGV